MPHGAVLVGDVEPDYYASMTPHLQLVDNALQLGIGNGVDARVEHWRAYAGRVRAALDADDPKTRRIARRLTSAMRAATRELEPLAGEDDAMRYASGCGLEE